VKIVFLDIDGVLNCRSTIQKTRGGWLGIDPEKVAFLSEIVNHHPSAVVLTSTWRLDIDSLHEAEEALHPSGIVLLAYTPDLPGMLRGDEIDCWLAKNQWASEYVILDDIDEFPNHQDRFVQTSFDEGGGLLPEHISQAIEILNRPIIRKEKHDD
jgi:hypothetical protein